MFTTSNLIVFDRKQSPATSIERDTYVTYFGMMCSQPIMGINTSVYFAEEGEHEIPDCYELLFNEVDVMQEILDDPTTYDSSKVDAITRIVSIAKTLLGFNKTITELENVELRVLLSDEFWMEWRRAIREREG